MNEVWKPVFGYEGVYEVSNFGRVKSLDKIDNIGRYHKGKIMRGVSNGRYFYVTLSDNGVTQKHYIHRLVANAFVPNTENKPQVNHIDENTTNNRADNLCWMTEKENSNWATAQKRKVEARDYVSMANGMKKILVQLDSNGNVIAKHKGLVQFCRSAGYNASVVSDVCLGRAKTAYGYKWKYE